MQEKSHPTILTFSADLEAYKQAFDLLRHYGTLRFSLLTAYIFIGGGLFTLALRIDRWSLQFIFPLAAGIVIALVFWITEVRINEILTFYAGKIEKLGKVLNLSPEAVDIPPRTCWYRSIELLTSVIYLGSILLWIIAALNRWLLR